MAKTEEEKLQKKRLDKIRTRLCQCRKFTNLVNAYRNDIFIELASLGIHNPERILIQVGYDVNDLEQTILYFISRGGHSLDDLPDLMQEIEKHINKL